MVSNGTIKRGEPLDVEPFTLCNDQFGKRAGRRITVPGGGGTLESLQPVKSRDHVRRAGPFCASRMRTGDEPCAITAILFCRNDVPDSEGFDLTDRAFGTIKLPNEPNFFDDGRHVVEKALWRKNPCMSDCLPGAAAAGRVSTIEATLMPREAPRME